MKKYVVLFLAGTLFANVSHALIAGGDVDPTAVLVAWPIFSTFLPTVLVMDSGETVSIADKLPELEAEINAGPENYYYLRALAKQVSNDPKYNGDTEKALADVIMQVKAQVQAQKTSAQ
ncbi:MAG: hypothetical protein ACXVCY_02040 [Pseudobdellovibrionaceae bacterium]